MVDMQERHRLFYVPFGEALVGISLGAKFPIGLRARVGDYALQYPTEITDMQWQNGFPQPLPVLPQVLLASVA
jgi:hypothetical protein